MAFSNGYTYRKLVTQDHTKVSGGADLTDFPVLVSVTDARLKTVANGGAVQSSSGYDIRFETAGGTKLDHEVESWSATTGALIAWVRIPTLGYAADTTFYLYYGNASVVATEQNPTGVWDSFTGCVEHFGDGVTLTYNDSTSNANTATLNSTPTAAAGKWGAGAVSLNGTSGVEIADSASVHPRSAATVSAWVKPNITQGNWSKAWTKGHDAYITQQVKVSTTDGPEFRAWNAGNGYATAQTASISDGNWHHLAGTFDGRYLVQYVDGVAGATFDIGSSTTLAIETNAWDLGGYVDNSGYTGLIDEWKIASTARSSGWLATEFNNQSSPSTFESFGSEDSSAGIAITSGTAGEGEYAAGTVAEKIAATATAGEGEGVSGAAAESIAASGTAGEGEAASGTLGESAAATGTAGEAQGAAGTVAETIAATGTAGEGEGVIGFTGNPPINVTGTGGEGQGGSGVLGESEAAAGSAGQGEQLAGAATESIAASGSGAQAEGASGSIAETIAAHGTAGEGESMSGSATITTPGAPTPLKSTRVFAGPLIRATRVYAGPLVRVTRVETFPS